MMMAVIFTSFYKRIILMKKLQITLVLLASMFGITGTAQANDNAYILIAHNSYTMTVTKIASARTLEQCKEAQSNFAKEFPEESHIVFKCIPIPIQMV